MKKNLFALLRLFVFVALAPMLVLSLVSCDPDDGTEDAIENVGGNENDTAGNVDEGANDENVENESGDGDASDEGDTPKNPVAVDLGLPSGLKWASCNVGATSPEEYGGYYAWGEVEEKSNYSWSTYKWCNGSYDTQTKYCTSSSCGTVDNKTTLDPEDDVAHVQWGGNWRMPTKTEQDELRSECSWFWTSVNGVNGYQVTGPNGNSLFLPVAGCRYGEDVILRGANGFWSATLYSYNGGLSAYYLDFGDGYYDWLGSDRDIGFAVRPVTE